MTEIENEKPASGFDRGVDYKSMKQKFINEYEKLSNVYTSLDENDRWYRSKRKKVCNNIIYLLISMIQLSNGSRVSEAVNAFRLFLKQGLNEKVIVKIAKSKATKIKDGKQFTTKTRYRKIKFPNKWIDIDHIFNPGLDILKEYADNILNLEKYTLNYMLRNHDCNTHSLRYAFINYMLYDQKKEMTIVAKFVGHSNIQQLIRYTQNKETDKLFDLDI